MKSKISAWEAGKQLEYIDNFMSEIKTSSLRDALLEFVITFSVFENLFGTIRLSENPFEKLDNSFAEESYDFFRNRYVRDGELAKNYKLTLWKNGYRNDSIARTITPLLKSEEILDSEKLRRYITLLIASEIIYFMGIKGRSPLGL